MRYIIATIFLFLAAVAQAESGVAFSFGGLRYKIGAASKNSFIGNTQYAFTQVGGDGFSGFVSQESINFSYYSGPLGESDGGGSFTVLDLGAQIVGGYRIGPFTPVVIAEYRYPKTVGDESNVGQSKYLSIGGGFRLRLAPAGYQLSGLALQASYLIGSLTINDVVPEGSSAQKTSYDLSDLKLRLTYSVTKKWTLFTEGRETKYKPTEVNIFADKRTQNSVLIGFGKSF